MKNGRDKLKGLQGNLDTEESQLLVSDIVRYLSGMAKLQEDDRTGNPRLGEGLRQVAKVLRPYANCPVSGLTDAIQKKQAGSAETKVALARFTLELPDELESIDQEEIVRIVENVNYTKQQIAELGFRRFGISRSKLERLSKKDALDSVRAALEHEKSLDVISQEAVRSGSLRVG